MALPAWSGFVPFGLGALVALICAFVSPVPMSMFWRLLIAAPALSIIVTIVQRLLSLKPSTPLPRGYVLKLWAWSVLFVIACGLILGAIPVPFLGTS
jgi:hypothetical protein